MKKNSLKLNELMGLTDEEVERRLADFLQTSRNEPPLPSEKCNTCGRFFWGEKDEKLGVKCCHWGQVEAK